MAKVIYGVVMERQKLKRKYGLITATAIIVGTVVGSGIFFRTGRLLNDMGGNIALGLLSWIISGGVMFVCAFVFSMMAHKYEKVNGLMDYSEELIGKKYSYGAGWFLSILYGPTIAAIVAWVAATYTAVLFNIPSTLEGDIANPQYNTFVFTMTFLYIILIFAVNFFSPKIAGKFQVSTTIIKLVPLILMGIVGIIFGLINGIDINNVSNSGMGPSGPLKVSFFAGIVTTAYAYDGWGCISSLNSEIKNSKRNMPLALLIGSILIIAVYILYFLGVAMAGKGNDLLADDFTGTQNAFMRVFGKAGSVILVVFVIISCLGAVNGNTMSANRMLFSLGTRNWGPMPKIMSEVGKNTDVPFNSALFSLLLSMLWVLVLLCSEMGWFGHYRFVNVGENVYFDIGDIAAIGFYILCVPIFFAFIIKEKQMPWYKRFLMPVLAVCAASFMVVALFLNNWELALIYIGAIVLILLIGLPFYRKTPSGGDSNIETDDTQNLDNSSIDKNQISIENILQG